MATSKFTDDDFRQGAQEILNLQSKVPPPGIRYVTPREVGVFFPADTPAQFMQSKICPGFTSDEAGMAAWEAKSLAFHKEQAAQVPDGQPLSSRSTINPSITINRS